MFTRNHVLSHRRYLSGVMLLLAIAGSILLSSVAAEAGTISTQNSVVLIRVGDGSTALNAMAAAVFLEEYAISYTYGKPTSATHVQTIPVPTAGATGTRLTMGGTAALEGSLNFSANGQYLMFGGYDANLGNAASAGNPRRTVGRLDMNGNLSFDAIYINGSLSGGNALRSVASLDGNQYWVAMSGQPGIGYRTWSGGDVSGNAGISLYSAAPFLNSRRVEIFDPGTGNQLYVGSNSGMIQGVATVGTGTPTTTSQTHTLLPGMPTATGPSTVDFYFADAGTLYVADDRTNVNGGLQKWIFDSGSSTWSLAYTANINPTGATLNNALRGLTGSVDEDGNVILFGTSTYGTNGAANYLVGIWDTLANTNAANVVVNTLASSASIPGVNGSVAHFRGLESIGINAIPEPGAAVLLLLGGLFSAAGVRRR